jgi:hypothetical protein
MTVICMTIICSALLVAIPLWIIATELKDLNKHIRR